MNKYLAIAESGSTKADWIFINSKGNRIKLSTPGFNPFTTSVEHFKEEIGNAINEKLNSSLVKELHFFAAGVNSIEKVKMTQNLLGSYFTSARIEVSSDLMAACYATSYGVPGIVSILGTGSNCCYFDGNKIVKGIDSLGWAMGDEGGGVYLGKEWIRKYIYQSAPVELCGLFYESTGLDKQKILEAVYHQAKPNHYLAQFSHFLYQHKSHPYIKYLVINSFKEFIRNHLLKFDQFRSLPLHFVGSIAYYFMKELKLALAEYHLSSESFIQKPIDHLEKVIVNLSNKSLWQKR